MFSEMTYSKNIVKSVMSPDQTISVDVMIGDKITYTVKSNNKAILLPSEIGIILYDGEILGTNPKLRKTTYSTVNKELKFSIYKKEIVNDVYNEMRLNFSGSYSLVFRVFNDGMAYRFETSRKGDLKIKHEISEYNFPSDGEVWCQYVNRWGKGDKYYTTYENDYTHTTLSALGNPDSLIVSPMIVELENAKIALLEVNLEDYPGMYLCKGNKNNAVIGDWAEIPDTYTVTSDGMNGNDLEAEIRGNRLDYIAQTTGFRAFPWRAMAIASSDIEFANNDMVYRLADSSRINDESWIKPGKVAWDWWIENDLWGVDFVAGVNYDTYKAYIDFASENGLEYILIDVGFSDSKDIMKINPDLRIKELVEYAKKKNVGIWAWSGWLAIKDQMEAACSMLSEIGLKGLKIDFMNRDDQPVVNFYYDMAKTAAKYHLMLDFHGAYKPTGLQKTYPNVLSFEGVKGQEWCRWTHPNQPKHVVTFPYLRMLAGAVDFTPGVFRSESKDRFKTSWIGSMGQGTRAHQMAMYVVFESPLQMLSDSPSRYREQQECTNFIAPIPTVWKQTKALDGKIGEYIIMARETYSGEWYVGALTDWNERDLIIDFSFLESGKYKIEVFSDGANSNRYAADYKHSTFNIDSQEKLKIKLASGGGWIAKITKL